MGQYLSRREINVIVLLSITVSVVSLGLAAALFLAQPSAEPANAPQAAAVIERAATGPQDSTAANASPIHVGTRPALTLVPSAAVQPSPADSEEAVSAATNEPGPATMTGASATTTVEPSPTATREPTATTTATPSPTVTLVPMPEGMASIPPGYFTMGAADGAADEKPEHPVLLDGFFIDLYEASNADYQQCVDADACTPGKLAGSYTRRNYASASAFADYPVIGVDWWQARAYCRWAGKRLPTEAEWEYAASGPENFTWPWGKTFAVERLAALALDTQPVDSYPNGRSPFGVYNMAGNVAEWVADAYMPSFYASSPAHNPLAEGENGAHVYRGGSFDNPSGDTYTTSRRFSKPADYVDVDIGFRCTMPAARAADASLEAEFCQVFLAYKRSAVCP